MFVKHKAKVQIYLTKQGINYTIIHIYPTALTENIDTNRMKTPAFLMMLTGVGEYPHRKTEPTAYLAKQCMSHPSMRAGVWAKPYPAPMHSAAENSIYVTFC